MAKQKGGKVIDFIDDVDGLKKDIVSELNKAYAKGRQSTEQALSIGWLCPRCGRGNSPTSQTCLCVPFETKVTC